ncbi:hypothetical protein DWF00_05555 [Bosea caraganae]|uniref:DUF4189 domain-containing protein n=1 Tax=Bosea caraganae TaxID=2763117 RepID=A0A370L331_9HYPH|nr:hypothetical protein [Bosea caraganae]RDJ22834.1 hypothetical protein DWE98_16800 [Bosea caraganae]RDJ28613.1 hypothetical protein DWF00_05555 [Bosea caraganae]
MKALIAVICAAMMSGCAAIDGPNVAGEADATEMGSPEYSRHFAELAAEAAKEKAGPRTCTIKGGMVNCF